MAPVTVENDNPAESEGDIAHDATGPPVFVGLAVVMTLPVLSCVWSVVYEITGILILYVAVIECAEKMVSLVLSVLKCAVPDTLHDTNSVSEELGVLWVIVATAPELYVPPPVPRVTVST